MPNNLFDEYKDHPLTVLITGVALLLPLSFLFNLTSQYSPIYFWIVCLMLVVIYVYHSYRVLSAYIIPKAKQNQMGIVFLICAESREKYNDTVSKLVEIFAEIMCNKESCSYRVITVPYSRSRIFANKSLESIRIFLNKKRCKFYIKVVVKSDEVERSNYYETCISTAVVHKSYNKKFQELIQSEFNQLSTCIAVSKYTNKEKMQILRMRASQLHYICQYLIAITICLNGSVDNATVIFDELTRSIALTSKENDVIKYIDEHLKFWGFHSHMDSAINILERILDDEKGFCFPPLQQHLLMADSYIPNKYSYNLNMAFLCVLDGGRIDDAEKHILLCKENPEDQTWRYSDAFLCAYKCKSGISIYKKYIAAFKYSKYSRTNVIKYVERILKERKDLSGLYLALALIYAETKQPELAIKNFTSYIEAINRINLQQWLVIGVKTRYGIDLLSIII